MIARLLFALSLVVAGIVTSPAVSLADQFFENGTDRPGSDYSRIEIPKPTGGFATAESLCQSRCDNDNNCKAWTSVKPGVQATDSVCYLKNAIPNKVANNCCSSGVPQRAIEATVDRPGNDYKNTTGGDAGACQAACQNDNSCEAWTWVKPGVQGADSVCYLKRPVPDAFTNDCCTSGVAQRAIVVK